MNTSGGIAKKRTQAGQRFRRICFTLNNYTTEEYEWFKKWTLPTWLVVGRETGESGTPHLQGACILGGQMTLSSLKKLPGFARAHIETMHGTPMDSLAYCTKEDTLAYEFGKMPKEGKNAMTLAVDLINSGATMKDLAKNPETAPTVVRYYKGLNVLRSLKALPRNSKSPPKVFWIHGPTGVGKTRLAHKLCARVNDGVSPWISSKTLDWFDGYDGQRCVILDELRAKDVNFAWLLRLLDRYTLDVPIKGAFVQWCPEFIFITTSYGPTDTFATRNEHKPEDLEQLRRRITGGVYAMEHPNGYGADDYASLKRVVLQRIADLLELETTMFKDKVNKKLAKIEEMEDETPPTIPYDIEATQLFDNVIEISSDTD